MLGTLYLSGADAQSLQALVCAPEFRVMLHPQQVAFPAAFDGPRPACAILSADAVEDALAYLLLANVCTPPFPVILAVRTGRVRDAVIAMQRGAFWCFDLAVCDPATLRGAVGAALTSDQRRNDVHQRANQLWKRVQQLSGAERRLFELIEGGATVDRIVEELESTPQTVSHLTAEIVRALDFESETQLLVEVLQLRLSQQLAISPGTFPASERPTRRAYAADATIEVD